MQSRETGKALHEGMRRKGEATRRGVKAATAEAVEFSLQLTQEKVTPTACGLYEIDMPLMCSVSGRKKEKSRRKREEVTRQKRTDCGCRDNVSGDGDSAGRDGKLQRGEHNGAVA